MFEPNDLFADRYLLINLLGKGGFSEVWLAKDTVTDVEIALKIYASNVELDDAGITLFTQEFALVFDINHTNLLRPTHYDCWNRKPYLILPYCKNGSALCFLKDDQVIPEEDCWKLLHDVASGLAYLHGKNPPVIHQDIKPDNILIGDEGQFMITDFGISARVRSTIRRNATNENISGTLSYMGPERFGPTPAPIMASDIWSLGATLFELMMGMPPYDNMGGVLQKNGADIPLITNDYSEPLKEIVYKCLAVNPWDRPTAQQLVDGIEQAKREPAETAQEKEVQSNVEKKVSPLPDEKKKSFNFKVIAGCVILLLVALVGFIVGISPDSEKEEEQKVPLVDYESICKDLLNKGAALELKGDTLMHPQPMMDAQTNQLRYPEPKIDSNFEDDYIQALDVYKQIEHYKDSISVSLYGNVQKRVQHIQLTLDTVSAILLEKAEIMKKIGFEEVADTFQMRSDKIVNYKNKE